ncbi:hypothetical protein LGQ02_01615 [Bacillus shivajii]|uniref:hypothetical protein n=1 Tax=Bacillus shivajii TaxID=1983719 RepID=UPI001CFADCDB|nr:hypothetical protein [Bacillus shivajii]UCZ53525.1 hypothetical protein LGQ02_01615 [Bacillus shivajii]
MNKSLAVGAIDEFHIDVYGLALIIKLVELRVHEDIRIVRQKMESEESVSQKPKEPGFIGGLKNSYHSMKGSYDNWKGDQLTKEINEKQRWLNKWSNDTWQSLGSHQTAIRSQSLQEIKSQFLAKRENQYKLYLVLQEAVLTPVYGEMEGFPKGQKERDIYGGIGVISRECGFSQETGKQMLKEANHFLKEVNNYWGKVIKWSLAGTGAALLTAGLAAPVIAGAIGGAMGLSGAAATSAGLAAIGGGAIAAGGLGMAGGMQILIGGGALLGAAGGAGVANFVGKLPQDAISVSMVKIINYNHYLQTHHRNNMEAKQINERVLHAFLTFKHQAEREVLLDSTYIENEEKSKKAIEIMNLAYKHLLEGKRSY